MTTAQCLALGADRHWVRRQVTSGRWQRLHLGVLVTHSGPVLWRTRARGALLYAGRDAALSHDAAGFLHGIIVQPPRMIRVAIPAARRVASSPGLEIQRRRHLELTPGRQLIAAGPTVLDLVAEARSEDAAVGIICAAVRARITPDLILAAMAERARIRRRALVAELLGAVAEGIESPLEMRYHRDVERRHGLPASSLQVRDVVRGRWIRADCVYAGLGVRVELDGELAHPGGTTDTDVWRDNAVIIGRSEITLRYRWVHVRSAPCATAAQVLAALRDRGWRGRPRPCGPHCELA